jgi:hypothetical protein
MQTSHTSVSLHRELLLHRSQFSKLFGFMSDILQILSHFLFLVSLSPLNFLRCEIRHFIFHPLIFKVPNNWVFKLLLVHICFDLVPLDLKKLLWLLFHHLGFELVLIGVEPLRLLYLAPVKWPIAVVLELFLFQSLLFKVSHLIYGLTELDLGQAWKLFATFT